MKREGPRRPIRDRGGSGPPGLRLFNAIVVIRWISLAVASVGYFRNISSHEVDYGHFIPMLAVAILYTALLSWFARPLYQFHMRSRLFLVFDYGVTFAAFALTGTVWNPFLVFGACSFLFAGLRGTKTAGISGGLALSLVLVVALQVKGLTYAKLAASNGLGLAFVYILQFVLFSVGWAYLAELLNRLDDAYAGMAESRDELARANRMLDRRQEQLLALHRIRQAILLKLDAEEIVEIVMRALREMGFGECRIWLLKGEKLAAFPPGEEEESEVDARSDSPVAVAARDRTTAVTEPRRSAGQGGEHDVRAPGVVVPILAQDEVMGAVEVESTTGEPFSHEQVGVLELFVGQIALALRHVRLYDSARDFAMAEERNRIATEIHDNVVDKLRGADVLAESLSGAKLSPEAQERLRLLKDTILAGLKDLRFAVLNWNSLEWESAPTQTAERYAREFTALSGIPVTLETHGEECKLATSAAKDLLRILQETLSNVWRHAQACSVHVSLAFEPKGVSLTISDDGKGFDTTAAAEGSGIGLRSILRRGRRNDGTVEITTSPGEGTQVRVWMPCR